MNAGEQWAVVDRAERRRLADEQERGKR